MHIRYTGRSDTRLITHADLLAAGVELDATIADITFPRNMTVEVPDIIGEALTSHQFFAHQFGRVIESIPELEQVVEAGTVLVQPDELSEGPVGPQPKGKTSSK